MTTDAPTIRPALLSELPLVAAIDDASCALFTEIGIVFANGDDHWFSVAEREHWRQAVVRGDLYWAITNDRPVGFYALGTRDARAYLEQLSVLPEHGRRGIGSALLRHAFARCAERGARELWLTTYAHVPWNAPFYVRQGFVVVPEHDCSPELQTTLAEQRSVLPAPAQRVAMRRAITRDRVITPPEFGSRAPRAAGNTTPTR
jgi:GNAT superfamily N-acetyltransferase